MGRTKRKTRRSLKRRSTRSRRGGDAEVNTIPYAGAHGFLSNTHHLTKLKNTGSCAMMLGKRNPSLRLTRSGRAPFEDATGRMRFEYGKIGDETLLSYTGLKGTGSKWHMRAFNASCDTGSGEKMVAEAFNFIEANATLKHDKLHNKLKQHIIALGGEGKDVTKREMVKGFKELGILERAEWLRLGNKGGLITNMSGEQEQAAEQEGTVEVQEKVEQAAGRRRRRKSRKKRRGGRKTRKRRAHKSRRKKRRR